MKLLAKRFPRVLAWGYRCSHDDYPEYATVGLADLPALLARPRFRARFVPRSNSLIRDFEGLAHALLNLKGAGGKPLASDLLLIVDEVFLVVKDYEGGALGRLLRLGRPQGLHIFWATQEPTHIPAILRSACRKYYLFHLHDPTHLTAVRGLLTESEQYALPMLQKAEFLTVNLPRLSDTNAKGEPCHASA